MRCTVPDRPGALARLAGIIASAGGDIQAIDVVEQVDGAALDDFVVVIEPAAYAGLVQRLEWDEGASLVHVGPSRGDPGDAVTRLAVTLEALFHGALDRAAAVRTLLGGLLRADDVELVAGTAIPRESEKVMVLALDERVLVVRRAYRFTDTERHRAEALVRLCLAAEVQSSSSSPPG